MTVLRLRTEELAPALRKEGGKVRKCVDQAIEKAAVRWVKYLKHYVDDEGITNTGDYRDSFEVERKFGRLVVANDHPAAGVIELGCAPHPVSVAGQAAIASWCVTKLGLDEEEAKRAAFLICRKIREHGQESRYVVRNAIPTFFKFFSEELKIAFRTLKVYA